MIEHFHPLNQRGDGPFTLGRHVVHDARSRDYDARALVRHKRLANVLHHEATGVWDQGEIGQCTAEAAYGTLMTEPYHKAEWSFNGTGPDSDTLKLYKLETRLDNSQIPGSYPPDDTGSSGLWSMKALHKLGLISSYHHAFGVDTALQLLMSGAVSIGTPWYSSMFSPDKDGRITFDPFVDALAGGHQTCVVGYDADAKEVVVRNSWGTSWGGVTFMGTNLPGHYRLSVAKLEELLADHGDAIVPVV